MLDCSNCKYDYFCCKMRVKTSFWERLLIRLRGYWRCFEQDPEGKWLLKFPQGRCYFLGDNNKCKIYFFRPGVCRAFPVERDCREIYDENMKLREHFKDIGVIK